MEIYKDIVELPGYKVSNYGNIFSTKSKKILKLGLTTKLEGKGYYCCSFSIEGKKIQQKIHRLVAKYFCANPDNKTIVNHKDGNKLNNLSSNLEWVNPSENTKHAYDMGLMENVIASRKCGEDSKAAKLTKEDVDYIRANYVPRDKNFGTRGLARKFGISHQQISRIVNNKTWKE